MPRRRREEIKRRINSALNHIMKACGQLEVLQDQFEDYHPEYATAYENVVNILMTAHEFLEKIRKHI